MTTPDKITMFTNMAQSDPDNELAHFSLGKLHFEAGNHEQAESSLRRTLELNAQHAQAHRFLAETLLARGNKEEAIQVLTDGVRLAHVRGEYMPRNIMVDLLKKEGAEVPRLLGNEEEEVAAGDPDAFTCRRCLKANLPLDEPPFSGELGTKIHETICQECWSEWMAMSIKVINELRLNPATPQGSKVYDDHMKEYLGLS